jgi:hypothetical protein
MKAITIAAIAALAGLAGYYIAVSFDNGAHKPTTQTGQTASRAVSPPLEQEPAYSAPLGPKPAPPQAVEPYRGERHVAPDGTPLTDAQERCLERVRAYNLRIEGQWDTYRDSGGYYVEGVNIPRGDPRRGQRLPVPPLPMDERTCAF